MDNAQSTVLGNRLVHISDMLTRTSRYGDITIRCPRYNRDTKGGKLFLLQPQNFGISTINA